MVVTSAEPLLGVLSALHQACAVAVVPVNFQIVFEDESALPLRYAHVLHLKLAQ